MFYGLENLLYPGMKDGKCTKRFPCKLIEETIHNDNRYLLYCRRAETKVEPHLWNFEIVVTIIIYIIIITIII